MLVAALADLETFDLAELPAPLFRLFYQVEIRHRDFFPTENP